MINRRQLSRALAMGLAAAQSRTSVQAQTGPAGGDSVPWTRTLPGIWKATLGTPEAFTPVRSRLVPPAETKLAQLPDVSSPPLPAIVGTVTSRGCVLRIPMPPGELIYGFGLQMLSF